MVLAAFAESLAPKTAGAYRNFRLQNLIASAALIFFRMQERLNPLLLVRLQMAPHIPSTGINSATRTTADRQMLPFDPGDKGAHDRDGNQDHRRPQVRLLQDQYRRKIVKTPTLPSPRSVRRSVRTSLK